MFKRSLLKVYVSLMLILRKVYVLSESHALKLQTGIDDKIY